MMPEKAQRTGGRNRRTMSQMVIAADNKTQRAKILRKGGIACEVFTHAMGNLDNTPQLYADRAQNVI